MEIISKNLISILKAATKGRGPSSWSRVCVCGCLNVCVRVRDRQAKTRVKSRGVYCVCVCARLSPHRVSPCAANTLVSPLSLSSSPLPLLHSLSVRQLLLTLVAVIKAWRCKLPKCKHKQQQQQSALNNYSLYMVNNNNNNKTNNNTLRGKRNLWPKNLKIIFLFFFALVKNTQEIFRIRRVVRFHILFHMPLPLLLRNVAEICFAPEPKDETETVTMDAILD